MPKNRLKMREDVSSSIFIPLVRGIKLGFINFWRNKILSLATIVVIAVILFIFNVIWAVQLSANQALQSISKHLDIVVDLKDDIDFYDAQNLENALRKVPGVKEAKYTSKEEALQIIGKTSPETLELYKKFSDLKNPLPPSISIILEKPEDYNKVETFLLQSEYKNLLKNNWNKDSQSAILSAVGKNLSNMNSFVRQIFFGIIFAFVLGGTLVIVNAIELTIYTRRHEIYIMRLVGATPGFIRLPFIFEGILYSLFAALISFAFLFFVTQTVSLETNPFSSFETGKIFAGEFLLTIGLGIISSFSAVQRYLKAKLIVNS
jgi:cell division transport system permease protein